MVMRKRSGWILNAGRQQVSIDPNVHRTIKFKKMRLERIEEQLKEMEMLKLMNWRYRILFRVMGLTALALLSISILIKHFT